MELVKLNENTIKLRLDATDLNAYGESIESFINTKEEIPSMAMRNVIDTAMKQLGKNSESIRTVHVEVRTIGEEAVELTISDITHHLGEVNILIDNFCKALLKKGFTLEDIKVLLLSEANKHFSVLINGEDLALSHKIQDMITGESDIGREDILNNNIAIDNLKNITEASYDSLYKGLQRTIGENSKYALFFNDILDVISFSKVINNSFDCNAGISTMLYRDSNKYIMTIENNSLSDSEFLEIIRLSYEYTDNSKLNDKRNINIIIEHSKLMIENKAIIQLSQL